MNANEAKEMVIGNMNSVIDLANKLESENPGKWVLQFDNCLYVNIDNGPAVVVGIPGASVMTKEKAAMYQGIIRNGHRQLAIARRVEDAAARSRNEAEKCLKWIEEISAGA